MTNFIPIFPVETVVYPEETYRLHISKDSYKHLITDCFGENKPFGIIPILNNEPATMGTLVEIMEVVEVWEDGKMNIIVKGLQVFKILETINKIPEKLYAGAIVSYPDNIVQTSPVLSRKVLNILKEFHYLLRFTPIFDKEEIKLNSYDLAHTAGLSLREEFELLELLFENQRLEYLRRHLNRIVPVLLNIQYMLKRNAENNDFKKGEGFDFDSNQPL